MTRFSGVVKTWNDDRGFGFIEPDLGGQEIFVHIKAFRNPAGRPQPNQRVSFEVELNREGKKRARNVDVPRSAGMSRSRNKARPAQWGTASLFAIPAFLVVVGIVAMLWRVPGWLGLFYLVASVICFAAYALDKSAARAGNWRTAEQALLLLGLIGGWPGAIVAQQVFRHKSNKASFRAAFWISVLINVVLFVVINSPAVQWAIRK